MAQKSKNSFGTMQRRARARRGDRERQPRAGKKTASGEIGVVKAFIAAINRRAPAEISRLMAEDHTFVDSSGGTHSGRAGMTAGWEHYFRMFPDYAIRVDCILGEKSLVAVFGSASGTYNGKRGLVPENRIEMPAAWKAVVENDTVKLWQVFADWTDGHRVIKEDAEAG
ncbi:MAG: nuclear transport factor 2 family protein [Acidobacteriota bacterium]